MKKLIGFLITVMASSNLFAAMAVIDTASISKIMVMIDQLNEQYEQLERQFSESQIQTGVLSSQLDSITGFNKFAELYNSTADKEHRQWAPDSLEDFQDMLDDGFNPGDLADRYAYYQEKFPAADLNSIDPKNPNSVNRELYAYNEEWGKMNMVAFAQNFDAVNASYVKINQLLSEVDNHVTLKESADFNNRLLGELGYLLQSLVQIQGFDLHAKAMLQQAEQNNVATHANFFTFRKK